VFANIVGSFGNAILFVCIGVALVVVASYTVTLATHWYLGALQGTAAGIDRVDWPDEPIADWILQAVWLGGLVAITLALASVVNRILTRFWVDDPTLIRWFLLAGAGLWLFFPFCLLSSMASSSRWFIFSPRVLVRLFRVFGTVVEFYLSTGLLLVLVLPTLYLGLLMPKAWIALPVASALGGAVLLIHARLVGRLAWVLDQLERQAAAPPKRRAGRGKKAVRRPQAVEVEDPWAAPVPGYQVVEQPVEEAPRARRPSDPEDPDPYTLADTPAAEPAAPPPAPRLDLDEHKVEREIELRTRRPPNPPPASPMFSGVYTFPGYPSSQKVWFWLTLSGLATFGLTRAALMFWPG
jgi:hypothetical protein